MSSSNRRTAHSIAGWLSLLCIAGCAGQNAEPPESPPTGTPERSSVARQSLDLAMRGAADYLVRSCGADGRFVYRIQDGKVPHAGEQYNVLRHAGSVLALADYARLTGYQPARDAALRGADFLRTTSISPVGPNQRLAASWTDPSLVGNGTRRQAKLGGSALALAALLRVESLDPDKVTIEELRAQARFLLFMQKPDGSFYSKFFPDSGRDDHWHSVYYPGEAAFALLLLYHRDQQKQWCRAAMRGMEAIAKRADLEEETFPDQWFLLALAELESVPSSETATANWTLLRQHGQRLCRDMVAAQQAVLEHAGLRGCFTENGFSCPTATRLEGLLAIRPSLRRVAPNLEADVSRSINLGIDFLRRCQLQSGPSVGAFPCRIPGARPSDDPAISDRASEIRIDYVQHALSALMHFHQAETDAGNTMHDAGAEAPRNSQ